MKNSYKVYPSPQAMNMYYIIFFTISEIISLIEKKLLNKGKLIILTFLDRLKISFCIYVANITCLTEYFIFDIIT